MSATEKPLSGAAYNALMEEETKESLIAMLFQAWDDAKAERAKVEALEAEVRTLRNVALTSDDRATAAEAEVERMREGLEPFVREGQRYTDSDLWSDVPDNARMIDVRLTLGDLRRAAALAKEKPDAGEQKDPANG